MRWRSRKRTTGTKSTTRRENKNNDEYDNSEEEMQTLNIYKTEKDKRDNKYDAEVEHQAAIPSTI
eukprot:1470332-Amphidinium_carterae.2